MCVSVCERVCLRVCVRDPWLAGTSVEMLVKSSDPVFRFDGLLWLGPVLIWDCGRG